MLKRLLLCMLLPALLLGGCDAPPSPKIGISFGVGDASRWPQEMADMVKRSEELGMEVEARLNKTDTPKTQTQDCFELIDSGISVLVLVPRDARKVEEILSYARAKNVKVISYARAVLGENVDLFVGYDTYMIGKSLGLHLTEKVFKGNLAILSGDPNDFNTPQLYDGGMTHIRPLVEQGSLNVILDTQVAGWSAALAKQLLTEAVVNNEYKLDAVFAQNDAFAGVAAEVVEELGLNNRVLITGMDADLDGVRRVAQGTQDVTIYMDLKALAYTAVNEAYNLAVKKKLSTNSKFNNESRFKIDAYLINGKLVTRENLERVLIDTGVYTREQVYGTSGA